MLKALKNNDLFFSGFSLATSGSTMIGENTGVFVGGLPQGYTVVRKDVGEYGCGITSVFYSCINEGL